MSVAIVEGLLEDVLLNVLNELLHVVGKTFYRACLLLQRVAAHNLDGAFLKVACSHNEAYGHTLQLVISKLEARALVGGVVILDADTSLLKFVDDGRKLVCDGLELLVVLRDRNNHNLQRSELRRKHQSVIVRVGHDERSDKTCRHAP